MPVSHTHARLSGLEFPARSTTAPGTELSFRRASGQVCSPSLSRHWRAGAHRRSGLWTCTDLRWPAAIGLVVDPKSSSARIVQLRWESARNGRPSETRARLLRSFVGGMQRCSDST
jgi:hypothetical protein